MIAVVEDVLQGVSSIYQEEVHNGKKYMLAFVDDKRHYVNCLPNQ